MRIEQQVECTAKRDLRGQAEGDRHLGGQAFEGQTVLIDVNQYTGHIGKCLCHFAQRALLEVDQHRLLQLIPNLWLRLETFPVEIREAVPPCDSWLAPPRP